MACPLAWNGLVFSYPAPAGCLPDGNFGTDASKNMPIMGVVLCLRKTKGVFYNRKGKSAPFFADGQRSAIITSTVRLR